MTSSSSSASAVTPADGASIVDATDESPDALRDEIRLTLAERGLEQVFGARDQSLRRIERAFDVSITARGGEVTVRGDAASTVEHLLRGLVELATRGQRIRQQDVRTAIRVLQQDPTISLVDFFVPGDATLLAARGKVQPRSLNQHLYMKAMLDHDIVVSIGPAGTGKTFLAVAMAAAALLESRIKRIVLARPAVEAGEKLGFLPGDLAEKVNPYLRPLHDALHDLIGFDKASRLMEKGIIEVAPLA
ncbi:MAG: PhoH family protein, partial [Acidobacteriota bacterium]